MKNVNKLAIWATASMLTFSACQDDAEEIQLETGVTEIPETFSSYSPEENKRNLEDNGLELVNEMEGLKSAEGLTASSQLINLFDQAPAAPANGRMLNTARTLQSYKKGQASVRDIFASLRTESDEPKSIQEFYNRHTGTYTWNAQKKDLDFTRESDRIVFKYPAEETSTENNAEFVISTYKGIETANPIDEEYQGDLPTELVMAINVDGAQVLGYTFSAAYNEEGEPTNVTTTLQVSDFVFAINAQNEQEQVGARYALNKGNRTLVAIGAGAKGMFTAENIELVENSDDMNPGDVVTDVNAYFQLMNIKLAGNFDVEKFTDGYAEIYADEQKANGEWNEEFNSDEAVEKEAALLNESFNLVAFYADSKEKIADTEVYTYTDSYSYMTYEFDPETQNLVEKEVVEEYVSTDIRLVFADESKSDLETYFDEEFSELMDEVTAFVKDLEELN